MREIKFRAWLKREKRIVNVFQITQAKDVQFIKFNKWDNDINTPSFAALEDVELMQYTGLEYCQGNEVFEGDILIDKYSQKYIVIYENDGFCLKQVKRTEKDLRLNLYWAVDKEKMPIIGNIYENPELLEDGHGKS